ncbi:bifunctional adenosylcobinamide kinase/adenosylcobinamide-phosphate guanylyltransferase, partial [Acinetobacter baumannii]
TLAVDNGRQGKVDQLGLECVVGVTLTPNQIILVDCLTLWLTNLLLLEDQNIQQFECEQLLKILPTLESEVILVSNETGLGVVPLGEISRRFVDEAGRLHQALGQIANKVVFCVAGFPMILKGEK